MLGCKGDVVTVKRGHARNLLIPRKMAAYATPANKLKFDEVIKARKEAVESGVASTSKPKSRKEQQKAAMDNKQFKQLSEGETAVFIRSAVATSTEGSDDSESGKKAAASTEKLYGSVTAADIKAYFEEEGFAPVEISAIKLEAPIKTLGTFPVKVGDVTVNIQVLEDKVK
jgi:large subunit ribosomal protein L9